MPSADGGQVIETYDLTGAGSYDGVVTVVYRNVLGREPDAERHAYWVGQVNGGMSREEMVLLVSNATEFIAAHPLPSDSASDTGPLG